MKIKRRQFLPALVHLFKLFRSKNMPRDPNLLKITLERYGVSEELYERIVVAIASDDQFVSSIKHAHLHGVIEAKSGTMHELEPASRRAKEIVASLYKGDGDLIVGAYAWGEAYRRIAETQNLGSPKSEGNIKWLP